MFWPTCFDTCSNTVRGTRSVALPAENGTITRIDFVGHSWATAGAVNNIAEHAAAIPKPRQL
jgi:hypothetical protein